MEAGRRAAADGFWAYSLRVYARPDVAAACLRLQDEAGLDVNLLLFALYAGRTGRALGVDDWRRLDALVAPLREHVIQPVRHARRWLKHQPAIPLDGKQAGVSELRPALAALELQAERHVQTMLERELPSWAPRPAGADTVAFLAANLERYLQSRSIQLDTAQLSDLATLARAATPAENPEE